MIEILLGALMMGVAVSLFIAPILVMCVVFFLLANKYLT